MSDIVFLITTLRMFHFVMKAKINPDLFYNTKIKNPFKVSLPAKKNRF